MFRTAQITFRTTRFGGDSLTCTDIFRVFVVPGHFPAEHQDEEVVWSVHETGERDFEIIEWSWAD